MKNRKVLAGFLIAVSIIIYAFLILIIYAAARIVFNEISVIFEELWNLEPIYIAIIVLVLIFLILLAVLAYIFLRYGIKIINNTEYKFQIKDFIRFQ